MYRGGSSRNARDSGRGLGGGRGIAAGSVDGADGHVHGRKIETEPGFLLQIERSGDIFLQIGEFVSSGWF